MPDSRIGVGTPPRRLGWGSRTFDALRVRDFRLLWLSSLAGFMAMQMQMIARGWLIFDLTSSPMALALVMLSMGIPMTTFSLVGGAVTDRVSKRALLGWTLVASATITVIIAVLIHTGLIQFWHLLISGFVNGIVLSFQMPGRFSFIAEVVGEDRLVNATALNTASTNITRILAPALAGVMIGFIGTAGVFDLAVASYLLGALSVFLMRNRGEPGRDTRRTTITGDMRVGLRYVASNRTIRWLLILAFATLALGMPYQLLMPAFSSDVLELGPRGFGVLMATVGVGAIAGSLIVASRTHTGHTSATLFGAVILWGVGITAFSLAPNLALALIALLIAGLASAVFMTINMSLMQLHSDPELRGRVMSIFMLTFGLMPIGAVPLSAAASEFGLRAAYLGAGVLLIGVTAALFALAPPLRSLTMSPRRPQHAASDGAIKER